MCIPIEWAYFELSVATEFNFVCFLKKIWTFF